MLCKMLQKSREKSKYFNFFSWKKYNINIETLQLQKFHTPTLLMYLCKNIKYNTEKQNPTKHKKLMMKECLF